VTSLLFFDYSIRKTRFAWTSRLMHLPQLFPQRKAQKRHQKPPHWSTESAVTPYDETLFSDITMSTSSLGWTCAGQRSLH